MEHEVKMLLNAELKEYAESIGELTPTEKEDLKKWVSDGNSVHDNPFLLHYENGHLMDYINALRINAEMYEDYINSSGVFKFGSDQDVESDFVFSMKKINEERHLIHFP